MESEQDTPEEIVTPEKTTPETLSEATEIPQEKPVISADYTTHKNPRNKKAMIIALVVVLVLGAIAAAYFLVIKKDKETATSTTPTQKVTTTKTVKAQPTEAEKQLERIKTPSTGETWYPSPKPLPLQGYASSTYGPESADDGTVYLEVGKHGENVIILKSTPTGGGTNSDLFEKAPDGKVSVIIHPNSLATYSNEDDKYATDSVPSDISINTTQHYDSLSYPKAFNITSTQTVSQYSLAYVGAYQEKVGVSTKSLIYTTVSTYGGTKLVKKERPYVDTGLTAVSYSIITPISTEITLTYEPIVQTFDTVKWDDGSNLTGKFGSIIRGCGAGISVGRGDKVSDADFVKAGTASNGAVYNFKDKNNVTVQKAWQETKDFYAGNDNATDKAKATITLDAFIAKHGVFAYKDVNNGWLIYTNDDYAPVGGCAKPVVYLYPAVAQDVTVKVGADVKISDPLYNPNTGWKAFARPNGQLTVNGKNYGSLFWEGPGHGAYPGITSGTVVKRADAVVTMRSQLKLQGLNQTEINDFVDYWQTRIPNKAYVRLAWFDTVQMNELAPLTISPKPTSTIRVFLDMAGSDKNYTMPAPHFNAPARTGFTAVEWGGLSLGKLY